jgi:hypothetical protein
MSRLSLSVALALVPGLLVASGVAAAEERASSTIVYTPADVAGVRGAITFPGGWRIESGVPRQAHALAVDERCQIIVGESDFPDLATDVDDFEITLAPGSGAIFIGRETVELPAGPAERVDFADSESGASRCTSSGTTDSCTS